MVTSFACDAAGARRETESTPRTAGGAGRPPRRGFLPCAWWLALILTASTLSGCTVAKVVFTPVTVVRDTVDFPLVTLTNFFAWVAQSSGGPKAFAGPSWSWRSGFDFGASLNIAGLLCWAVSGVFGAVDYVVCRSFYPNPLWGISPWKRREDSWWSLYYTNTRALWAEGHDEEEPPEQEKPVSTTEEVGAAAQ